MENVTLSLQTGLICILGGYAGMLINALAQRVPARCGVDFTEYALADDERCLVGSPYLYEDMQQILPIPVIGWLIAYYKVTRSCDWHGRARWRSAGGYLTPLTLPLMEVICAISAPFCAAHSWTLFALLLLTTAITSCDVIAKWIPDVLTMSVTFLGLLGAAGYIAPVSHHASTITASEAILAYVVAWGSAFFLLTAISFITRRNALNFGDVWAFAAYAPFIGASALPFFGVSCAIVGIVYGVIHTTFSVPVDPSLRNDTICETRKAGQGVFPFDQNEADQDDRDSIPFGPSIAAMGLLLAITGYNPFL